MIVALSGRMHSGKDLVATIVRFLLWKQAHPESIYTLESFLHSGDSIITDWEVKKYAYKLKQIATILTGIPIEKWEDQEFKKSDMPDCWNVLKQVSENEPDGNSVSDGYMEVPMTVREFLQRLGTDSVRNGLHVNTWCNALMSQYKANVILHDQDGPDSGSMTNPAYPNWIISDMRFPNEFEAVKERGGICVRIKRIKYATRCLSCDQPYNLYNDRDGCTLCGSTDHDEMYPVVRLDEHPSEMALDAHNFDWVLNNDGTIEDLIEEVRKMLEHFKLLP